MNIYKRVCLCTVVVSILIIIESISFVLEIKNRQNMLIDNVVNTKNTICCFDVKDNNIEQTSIDFVTNCYIINDNTNETKQTASVDNNEAKEEQKQVTESCVTENSYLREDIPLSFDLQEHIYNTCNNYNIDYRLVLGLIQAESSFDESVISSAGCYGLMQLNPRYFPSDLNSYDNVQAGIEYLYELLNKYDNDVSAALRAYNRGYDDGARGYSNVVISYAKSWGYSD